MKPLQNQYQDLLEGKISKFNFLNNIKRTLPDLVSNVTSFDDAIKILKNKRVLSEVKSVVKEDIELEDIVSKYVKDANDIEKEMEAYHSKGYAGFSDMLKANLSRDMDFQSWTQKGHDEETLEKEIGESLNEDWGSSDQATFNKAIHNDLGNPTEMPMPFDPKFEAAVESAVDFWWDEWDEYASDRDGLIDHAKRTYYRSYFPEKFAAFQEMFSETKEEDDAIIATYEDEQDAKHTLPGGHLRENVDLPANLINDIDKVNPLEYSTGLDYELDLSGDFSADGLEKAVKKVLKNLKKDAIYYTNLKAELTSKINKKEVEAAKQVEVKKDNHVDKLNNLKTLVKKELANTKTSLSKKEKVTRATPQGVKLMKEERDVEARYQEYVGKLTHGNKANIEKQWKDAGEDMVKKHKVVVRAKELSKIKEYLTKQLKKEAVKFTIGQTGQEHEYKNPKDAPEFEKDLKAAGVKFTKSNV